MFSPFNTKLAGVSFGDCQQNIKKWGYDDIGFFRLEREPENPHDPNAIGIWFLNDRLPGFNQLFAKVPVAQDRIQLIQIVRQCHLILSQNDAVRPASCRALALAVTSPRCMAFSMVVTSPTKCLFAKETCTDMILTGINAGTLCDTAYESLTRRTERRFIGF
jgi:hypothetical protein